MGTSGLTDITLRDAVAADRDAIIAISTITQHEHEQRQPDLFLAGGEQNVPRYFDAYFSDVPRDDDTLSDRLIVACQADRVVGHALLIFSAVQVVAGLRDVQCHVNDLSVRPDFRGMGVGTALLARVDDVCRQMDATIVQAYVWSGNDASGQLFANADFASSATLFTRRIAPPQKSVTPPQGEVRLPTQQPTVDSLVIIAVILAILLVAKFAF